MCARDHVILRARPYRTGSDIIPGRILGPTGAFTRTPPYMHGPTERAARAQEAIRYLYVIAFRLIATWQGNAPCEPKRLQTRCTPDFQYTRA